MRPELPAGSWHVARLLLVCDQAVHIRYSSPLRVTCAGWEGDKGIWVRSAVKCVLAVWGKVILFLKSNREVPCPLPSISDLAPVPASVWLSRSQEVIRKRTTCSLRFCYVCEVLCLSSHLVPRETLFHISLSCTSMYPGKLVIVLYRSLWQVPLHG